MSYHPLQGVRVIEWARDFPGPHCGRKLADMGADVVKLANVSKHPGGRPRSPYSAEFRTVLDRNKRSLALDFDDEDDRRTIARLCDIADVIIDGARPGAFSGRLGVDLAQLRKDRPEVVICSVSGYGQTGPFAGLAAHGLNLEAQSFSLHLENHDGHWILNEGSNQHMAIEAGPLNGAFAVVCALLNARATGQGAWIDASCFDAGAETHRHRLTDVLNGKPPSYDVPTSGPTYTTYDCADGRPVFFSGGETQFWTNFCNGIGRADLLGASRDPEQRARLGEELRTIFMTATSKEWQQRFLDWNVCSSDVVMSLEELAQHPHFIARELVTTGPDGTKELADPIRWMDDGSRPGQDVRFPAGIGADTDAVLGEWLGEERGSPPRS